MKALVVDDDPITLTLLRDSLKYLGYEVATARNGREALEHLDKEQCRLVISDWIMPEMDGIALCKAIRERPIGGYVYIVLLTSKGGTTNLVEGYAAGADDFMSKPFEPAELNSRLRTARRILSLESRDVTIFALARLAESRESNTGIHVERSRCFAQTLSRDLAAEGKFPDEINGEFIRLIYLTSPLHDIGKIGIPDNVLLKTEPLDKKDYETIKTHTTRGATTLDEALKDFPEARFLRMARDIVLNHHERYDGTGYPKGIRGDDIPLCARIYALADAYDAMISEHVYKGAIDFDRAREEIVAERGKQFDPDVVDSFLRCEERFIEIGNTAQDPTETHSESASEKA
ncbi:MAG: response regulator [Phycisphaerae bacterium]|nr:response regulator [Phycisphaerae bacterium]